MNDLLMLNKYFPEGILKGALTWQIGWVGGSLSKWRVMNMLYRAGDEPILRAEHKDALQSFYLWVGFGICNSSGEGIYLPGKALKIMKFDVNESLTRSHP